MIALKAQTVEIARYFMQLIVDVSREFLRMVRWFGAMSLGILKWLSASYLRIETSILGVAVDVVLSIVAMRYFVFLVLIGCALFVLNIWVFLVFALFVCVAVIRFFRSADIDVRQQAEAHIESRINAIKWLRWPLRASASVAMYIFTSSTTLLSPYFIEVRSVFDSISAIQSSELSTPKESNQAPRNGKNVEEARLESRAEAEARLKIEAKAKEETLAAVQAKREEEAKAQPKTREEAKKKQFFPAHETSINNVQILPTHDSIILDNKCGKGMHVAVNFAPSEVTEHWVTKGWWNIPGHEMVTLDIQSHGENIYIFAEQIGSEWDGKNQSNPVLLLTVEDRSFTHYAGLEYYGKNMREVAFSKVKIGKPYGAGKPYGDVIVNLTCV